MSILSGIIHLNKDPIVISEENDVEFVYAYDYDSIVSQEEREKAQNFLENIDDTLDEVADFVEDGVFALDKYRRLNEFGAVIVTYSLGLPLLTELIHDYCAGYCTHNFISFDTFKKVYEKLQNRFELDPEEKQIYLSLQGVNVLIFDDFLTSGVTVKEIIRYLKSFNENNTLTVFVLVKQ